MAIDRDASELISMLVDAGSGVLRIGGPLSLPALPVGRVYEIGVIEVHQGLMPAGGFERVTLGGTACRTPST